MTDRSTDPKRFDPRFDPAFQPGYDPRNDPAIAARAVAASPQPRRPDPVGTPPERLQPQPAAQHRAAIPVENAQPTEAAEVQEGEGDDASSTTGANPFVIALWVISVLLIAGGITVFRAIPGLDQQTTGTGAPISLAQLFGFGTLAAFLIGAGVLVAAGNLFLLAVRWRGRSRGSLD